MAQRQAIPNWVLHSFSVYRGNCQKSRYCAIAYCHDQGSLVIIVTSYKKRPLFAAAFRSKLRCNQAPNTRALGSLSPGIKGPGSKSDHSAPCSAEVKGVWRCTSSSPHIFYARILDYLLQVYSRGKAKAGPVLAPNRGGVWRSGDIS